MLFYFHTTRRVDVDKLEPAARNKFLANVDCSATNAFFPIAAANAQLKRSKHRMLDDRAVKDVLLESMQKYFDLLGEQQAAVAERREEHDENSAAVADENQTAAVANWIILKSPQVVKTATRERAPKARTTCRVARQTSRSSTNKAAQG